MNLIFGKLTKFKKTLTFFCKLKKVQKHRCNFLKARKS
eukprot:UN23566